MLGTWRLIFYGVVVVVSTLLSILSTYDQIDKQSTKEVMLPPLIRNPSSRTSSRSLQDIETERGGEEEEGGPTVKTAVPFEKKIPPVPVLAPWTQLITQGGGHTYPRSFIFEETTRLDDYGLKIRKFDDERRKATKKKFEGRICRRAKKFATTKYDAQKCNHGLEMWTCKTCSEYDGSWYAASSVTGAAFGKAGEDGEIRFPYYNDGPFMYRHFDIIVPIAGQDNRLKAFADHLGSSVKKFRESLQGSRISLRLLITRFGNEFFETDEAMQEFQNDMIKRAQLDRPGDAVEFVLVPDISFSRAKAVNALHAAACHSQECVLACTDVDMNITSHFLRNALMFPFPGASAYFPIMWSEFNPETVEVADKFMSQSAQWKFTDHHGYWRKSSYGMYVIAGSDAKVLKMNERFVGWGGEDNDFFGRVSSKLNVIRMHEKGLTHVWHEKNCHLGSFVENDFFKACIGAKAHTEGSQLGLYLRSLRIENPEQFKAITAVKTTKVETIADSVEDDAVTEKVSVLIAVITSREFLSTRVARIMKTWGDPNHIPDGITFKFFVGASEAGDESFSGSETDVEDLAKRAGLPDTSMIKVMKNVQDNEYPPVRKNSAMIQHLETIVTSYENDEEKPSTFQWIFKVDDDAYVHLNGLLRFVKKRNPVGYHVYGERGYGRKEDLDGLQKGGLSKPYCTGGPGYIFSRPTLKRTARGLQECIEATDNSPYREFLWHSDVVIGMCVEKQTGAGCWTDGDYDQKRIFRNNHRHEDPFILDSKLEWMVSMHPFKDEASILQHHQRYIDKQLLFIGTKNRDTKAIGEAMTIPNNAAVIAR